MQSKTSTKPPPNQTWNCQFEIPSPFCHQGDDTSETLGCAFGPNHERQILRKRLRVLKGGGRLANSETAIQSKGAVD